MGISTRALSKAQQTKLLADLQEQSLFPVTFRINETTNTTNFPHSFKFLNANFNYKTLTWTPRTAHGIVGVKFSASISPDMFPLHALPLATNTIAYVGVQISYASTWIYPQTNFTSGFITQPVDVGNVIFETIQQMYGIANGLESFDEGTNFDPHSFYAPANQPIYIHLGCQGFTGLFEWTVLTNMIAQVTLHTLRTNIAT